MFAFLDDPPLRELPRRPARARTWVQAQLRDYGSASGEDPARLHAGLRVRAQILLVQDAGDEREVLLRLRDALG